MEWVYRLQQRIAITRNESTVLLVLALLFGVGLAARYVQQNAQPLPQGVYAEEEMLFREASEATHPEAAHPEALPASDVDSAAPASARPAYAPKALPAGQINLNTASAAELQQLPRIGPKLAARIIAYREAQGPFRRVQDLVRVRGIGQKTLARLLPHLTVEDEPERE